MRGILIRSGQNLGKNLGPKLGTKSQIYIQTKNSDRLKNPVYKFYKFVVLGIFLLIFFPANTAFLPAEALAKAGASPIAPEKIIELTNQKRIESGISALFISTQLTSAAQDKAVDLVKRNYWSHQTPEGEPFWSFADEQNYDWIYLGENLAADFETSEKIVDAWLSSPSHRKNLLNENYQDIGIGIYENIAVALYGTKNQFFLVNPLKKIPELFLNFYFLLFNF